MSASVYILCPIVSLTGIRAFIVVDNYSQEYLTHHAKKLPRDEDVVRVMEELPEVETICSYTFRQMDIGN